MFNISPAPAALENRASKAFSSASVRLNNALAENCQHGLAETDVIRAAQWSYITARDVGVLLERIRYSNNALADTMRKLGFRSMNLNVDSKQVKAWVRGPEALARWIVKNGIRYVVAKIPDGTVAVRPSMRGC